MTTTITATMQMTIRIAKTARTAIRTTRITTITIRTRTTTKTTISKILRDWKIGAPVVPLFT